MALTTTAALAITPFHSVIKMPLKNSIVLCVFQLIELCADTRKHALTIVDAFGHPEECVTAPIAGVKNEDVPWAFYPAAKPEHLSKL